MARFGFAKDLITPPFKTTISCSGIPDAPFQTIHDDVYVRAAVFEDGNGVKSLIVAFDLLFHSPQLFGDVRAMGAKYGVLPENVLANATHDHNSPPSAGYGDGHVTPEYETFLLERTSACVDRVFCTLFEGTLEYGVTRGEWNINRRALRNGKMSLYPNPDGVIDDRMDLLAVKDATGKLRGLITVYGCHPVHYPDRGMLSSEYPGRLNALLEAEYYGCTALFLQGAGGNSRPKLTAKNGGFKPGTFEELDEMASSMAKAAGRALRSCALRPVDLAIAGRMFDVTVHFDRQPFENFRVVADNPNKPPIYIRNAKYTCAHYDAMPDTMPLHCGIIRLALSESGEKDPQRSSGLSEGIDQKRSSGLCLAYMGGEPCFEVKFLVEAALPGTAVIFAGFTDDCDYIATDKLLAEGGYEADGCYIEYCRIGPISQGIDALLDEAFRANAQELHLK